MKSPQTSTAVNAMKPVAASGGSIVANFDVLDDGEDAAGRRGARLLNLAILALGLAVIGTLGFASSNADGRLRFAAQSAATAPKSAARSSAAGDRAATGRARRAEERGQGAHGNAASGGAYHRGDEGGRGGLATPCAAPGLVLEPGDVGLGNRKAAGSGRGGTAAPPPLTGNEQHHERAGGNTCGPLSARLDLRPPRQASELTAR